MCNHHEGHEVNEVRKCIDVIVANSLLSGYIMLH